MGGGKTVRVRPASGTDLAPVTALDGLGDSTRRRLRSDLAPGAPRHAAVATMGGSRVMGFAMTTRQHDAAHVLDIVVEPGWRRRGAATALLEWLAARALEDGTPAMTLEVRVGNARARAMYANLGFEDVGARSGYYADGEGARILWHDDLATLTKHDRTR